MSRDPHGRHLLSRRSALLPVHHRPRPSRRQRVDARVIDGRSRGDGHRVPRGVGVDIVLVGIVTSCNRVLPPAQGVHVSPGSGTRSCQLPRPKMRVVPLVVVVHVGAGHHVVQAPSRTRTASRSELAVSPHEARLGPPSSIRQRTVNDARSAGTRVKRRYVGRMCAVVVVPGGVTVQVAVAAGRA